jgi:hypothetical protein
MASTVDICNSALNMIGASNILSLTEDSKAARICNQRYEYVRDAVFRAHPWNCLIRRVALAADTATPAFDFSYQFTLPTNPYCLRVLRLEEPDTVFKIEGRKIVTNESSIKLMYVARVTDANEYDMLLIETLSARLAADISYSLVNSAQLTQLMQQQYEAKLKEARFVDATEGTPELVTNNENLVFAEGDQFIASRF